MSCELCDDRGYVVVADGGNGTARPCSCRVKAQASARLLNAQIPELYADCSIESFHGLGSRSLMAAAAAARRYVEEFLVTSQQRGDRRDTGLLFVGGTGTGKTHLAIAVLRELIQRYGARGVYVDFTFLIGRIKDSYDDAAEECAAEIMRPYAEAGVLVLDELGAATPTGHTKEQLYLLLNGRYVKRLPTIFTTNCPLEGRSGQGFDMLRDRVSAPVLSRLLEMAHVVTMEGKDYRLRSKR